MIWEVMGNIWVHIVGQSGQLLPLKAPGWLCVKLFVLIQLI